MLLLSTDFVVIQNKLYIALLFLVIFFVLAPLVVIYQFCRPVIFDLTLGKYWSGKKEKNVKSISSIISIGVREFANTESEGPSSSGFTLVAYCIEGKTETLSYYSQHRSVISDGRLLANFLNLPFNHH